MAAHSRYNWGTGSDQGANTLGRIAEAMPSLELPYLNGLGLHFLVPQFVNQQNSFLFYIFFHKLDLYSI